MSSCPKCDSPNDDAATRCRVCNAVLPIRLGAKSAVLYERQGAQPGMTGLTCRRCGAYNPYTRFKCEKCGVSLTQYKAPSLLDRAWAYIGLALIALLGIALYLRAR